MINLRKIKVQPNVVVGNKVMLPQTFIFSFIGNMFLLLCVLSLSVTMILMRENFLEKQLGEFKNEFYDMTSKIGFVIEDVEIEGRENSLKEDISQALEIDLGENILRYDIWAAKQRLEQLPWVKNAAVRRSYFPNIIHVSLREKKAQALWQVDNKFYPIDEDGNVIQSDYFPDDISLLVVGKGAPENLNDLIDIISQDNDIWQRIKVVQYVSERRWNIILDDIDSGLTIKLPEENAKYAWDKLIKIDATDGILKRKLTFIDLRLPDKVIVKLEKADSPTEIKQKKERNI